MNHCIHFMTNKSEQTLPRSMSEFEVLKNWYMSLSRLPRTEAQKTLEMASQTAVRRCTDHHHDVIQTIFRTLRNS